MKILFITNLLPYPLDNGGKIKTYNTLEILSKDNKIDLISFYENDRDLKYIPMLERVCSEVNVFKRAITTNNNIKYMIKLAIKNIFSKIPLVVYKFKDKSVESIIDKKLNRGQYDLVYIDHLQLGIYLEVIRRYTDNIVLDQHNCESVIILRKQQTEKSLLKRVYLKYEYLRLKRFEGIVLSQVNKIIVLSEEDKREMMLINNNLEENKFLSISIPVNIDYVKKIGRKKRNILNILFLGTMSWYPNSQGIEWFVKNIVPKLEENNFNYKLYIVGKDPSNKLIDVCKKYSNITITGFVDNVNEYIELCDVMVVPLFVGSGMRVKILEAMGKGIPVISTSVGAEGIAIEDGINIIIANEQKEFIESLKKVNNEQLYKDLQINGMDLFKERYSVASLNKKFLTLVEELKK